MRINPSRRRRRRGAAAVEMAMILPVFVLLIFGQLEAARLGMVAQMLTTAAREGCRVAVVSGNTQADVTTRVNAVLSSAGFTNVTTTQTPADCTTVKSSTSPNTITLKLSVPFDSVCWTGQSTYFHGAVVTASATLSSERP